MKSKEAYDFSRETILKKRKFPIGATVGLIALVIVQVACICSMVFYKPKPQDVIEKYTIYATPQSDGSLDIEYYFTWTALDMSEELTWIEIGMANEYFSILDERSDNIRRIDKYTDDDGYCYAQVYFKNAYEGGNTFDFSFKINQQRILASDGVELFYEFIPGWFNYCQIKSYTFYFNKYGDIDSYNGDFQDNDWLIWQGSLDYGDYVMMRVNYNSFDAHTVKYEGFYGDGAYNGLSSDKEGATAGAAFIIIIGLIVELVIVDAYVSYNRGRGFLRGYGHHVHVYGHVNPRYRTEAQKHSARSGGGGGHRF